MSDGDVLRQIEEMFLRKNGTPFDAEYDPLIKRLSFTNATFHSTDHDTLKFAWSQFLEHAFGHETVWEWPCNVGMAEWYLSTEMLEHAIAVYEHLYSQIRRGEVLEYKENYQEWLTQLFQLCTERGLTLRARHVAELISDYYADGLVSPVAYAEVLAVQDGLRYRELGELIDRDRRSAEVSLRTETGALLDNLHTVTRTHIIDAEVWNHPRLRDIEPTIAPRRYALAIEAEFNYKVFEPNRSYLEPALRSRNTEVSRSGKCCDLGQIVFLVSLSSSKALVQGVFSRLSGGPGLSCVPNALSVLKFVRIDRNKFSHSGSGLYTREQCSNFLRTVRETGWIFQFLSALQSR